MLLLDVQYQGVKYPLLKAWLVSIHCLIFNFFFFLGGGWGGDWVWMGGVTKHSDKTQFFEEASFFLSVLSVRVGQTPVTCPIDLKLKRPRAPTQPGLRGV